MEELENDEEGIEAAVHSMSGRTPDKPQG
jgi:hypothetical protein